MVAYTRSESLAVSDAHEGIVRPRAKRTGATVRDGNLGSTRAAAPAMGGAANKVPLS